MNTVNKKYFVIGGVVVAAVIIFLLVFTTGHPQSPSGQPQPNGQITKTPAAGVPSPFDRGKEKVVTLTASGFDPKTVTITEGTRVLWMNKSGKMGTVNSDDYPTNRLYPFLNLGAFPDGSSVQVVFDKAGTYTYHNHLNPDQTGKVIVTK